MSSFSLLLVSVGLSALTGQGTDAGRIEAAGRTEVEADTLNRPLVALTSMYLLGGVEEERLRLGHLAGEPTKGFLLRSPSSMRENEPVQASGARDATWALLAPEILSVWNSDLPFTLNDGVLWAGRGLSTRVSAGVRLDYRNVALILAPQLVREENRDFQTVAFPESVIDPADRERHPLASPFHYPPGSLDLPQRFGVEGRSYLSPGQSSLTVRTGALAFGAATENLWWGPGIRNALVMSAHAPGIPHVFLRTAAPISTGWGDLEARWMLGRLEESDYFDSDPANDHRSLSALVLVFTPRFDAGLTVGLARAVYAPSSGGALVPVGAALDFLKSVGRPFHEAGDTLLEPAPDQLFTLFGRWVFPAAGFEVYGEWARYEQPESVRDALVLPHRSRGYTVGLQWARPVAWGTLRLQSELTSLEPSTAFRVSPFGEWYASRTVPQGYTHGGQVIGAAIGPSGSSQWLAADLFGEGWEAGAFLGRIRWENQAEYTYPSEFRRADVTLFGGLRGGRTFGHFAVSARYTAGARLNYLFQAKPTSPSEDRGVDIMNHTFELTLTAGS